MDPSALVQKLHTPLPVHRLEGKVVIITGGAGRIGVETAGRLLRDGANVCIVDIDAKAVEAATKILKETLHTGQALQSRILTVVGDVTDESAVEAFVKRTLIHFRRLDCVFLNAGANSQEASIFDTNVEDYERIMRVNVKSAFLGLKHAAKAMRDLGNGGSIILTSSIAGMRAAPGLILDSGSKFAVRGLALTAASELGQYGIRVNTIHPSGIDGPLEEIEEPSLGRSAKVDDIAGVVAFLASEDSKFMTGGSLKIDGGSVVP